ncbi:MAG: LLM class F420-dependent oxidoreductase [Actinobacteria bacterium]|nr:LLM class F420-dependent oxidoreductase [Actinomycetota bacterium]
MLVDAGITPDLGGVANKAGELEALGYDGLIAAETSHDPFFPLLLAADQTERVQLATGIAVAFSRNPMQLATVANDLHLFSGGRFALGLGSQIKPHIEKRFSMPWSHPAARMREFVLALRAIWATWNDGVPLDFRGDFYQHTLMTPFFNPGPNPYGPPKVYVAAVGPQMTEVAGEVCDGLLVHGFTTEKYFRETTLPALERGMAKSGRSRADFEVAYPIFMVTGDTEEEVATAAAGVRQQLAFYGSTPAYRGVLEAHGWGDLQGELNRLSKEGKWADMGALVDDEILDAFAVQGLPEQLPGLVLDRFGDLIDRVSFYAPYQADPDRWAGVLAGFKADG